MCATTDELRLVEGGTVEPFDGDLEDYARRLRAKEQADSAAAEPVVGRKEQKRLEAEERSRRFARRKPLQARLRSAEREIEALGIERARLEKLIASPDMYGDGRKEDLKRCLLEQAQITAKLHEAEELWLALSTKLEQLTAAG